jgi:hypothetical protein
MSFLGVDILNCIVEKTIFKNIQEELKNNGIQYICVASKFEEQEKETFLNVQIILGEKPDKIYNRGHNFLTAITSM